MNKLEERFEEIYFEHIMGEDRENQFKSVAIYTKEAKDIAIEFARNIDSIMNKQDFNVIMTFEEMFDYFINQRYE